MSDHRQDYGPTGCVRPLKKTTHLLIVAVLIVALLRRPRTQSRH